MKEIKISFNITLLLNRCDVNYVEEELLKKRTEVFKGIMVTVLEQIEAELLKQGVKCPICGGEVIKKGSDGRKIETLLGRLDISVEGLSAGYAERSFILWIMS